MQLPAGYASVEEWTKDLVDFANQPVFKQLSGGIHVLDFFVLGFWDSLPSDWTDWFATVDNATVRQDLISGLDRPERPNSLTTFLRDLRKLSLPREHLSHPAPILNRQLSLGMKPKKVHEVGHFASLVAQFGQRHSIRRAIDIGAGQGYLSRTLAGLYDFDILAVDGQETQLHGSKQLTACVDGLATSGRVQYMVKMIHSEDLPDVSKWCEDDDSMVIALHACGSLTDDALRVFLQNERVNACAVIGCCYNHIRTRADGHEDGFPLSSTLNGLSVDLDGTARMLACQAPSNWTPDTSTNFFTRHFFRALFQLVVVEKGLAKRGPACETKMVIGALPKHAYNSFPAYVAGCLEKLGFNPTTVTTEEAARYAEEYGIQQDRIRIAWTLSAILAPLLESLIILDRYLFLKEQGIDDIEVIPCFDYSISPRNMVIVARK